MLALNSLRFPIPPLCLNLLPHRLSLNAQNRSLALEEPLVDVRRSPESQIAGAEDAGAREAQDVSGDDARHAEGEADVVAPRDEVGDAVDVDGDVVGGLGGEDGEEGADGVREGFLDGLLGGVAEFRCRGRGCGGIR